MSDVYTVDLFQYPWRMVMPIMKWCLDNHICEEQVIMLLQAWPDNDVDVLREDWVLNLTSKQALMFSLMWGGRASD